MGPNHSLRLLLLLALLLASCGPQPTADSTAPAPVADTPAAPTAIPALTGDQIRNAQYQLNARDDHPMVQLTNGQFVQGADPASPDYVSVFVTDFMAFGDLDEDGVDEAAAFIVENFGGTGNFGAIAVYRNENGAPRFVTSTFIDDRAMVNALAIDGGEVFLDAVVHSFEDPGCCPTLPTTRRYMLISDQLRLAHFTTATPSGAKREIAITSPTNGAEAKGSVQLSGNVTIAPFENHLSYNITDATGVEWAAGPVQVTAPDLGAPGTFDTSIDLSMVPAGATIFIELQDVSAADGSLLAMDSVQLVVK